MPRQLIGRRGCEVQSSEREEVSGTQISQIPDVGAEGTAGAQLARVEARKGEPRMNANRRERDLIEWENFASNRFTFIRVDSRFLFFVDEYGNAGQPSQ